MEIREEQFIDNLSNEKQEFENQISGYESAIFNLNSYLQDQTIPLEKRRESMQLIGYYSQILNEKNEILSGIRVSIFKMQQAVKQYQETFQQIEHHKAYKYPDLATRITVKDGLQTTASHSPEVLLKDISKLMKNSKKLF